MRINKVLQFLVDRKVSCLRSLLDIKLEVKWLQLSNSSSQIEADVASGVALMKTKGGRN